MSSAAGGSGAGAAAGSGGFAAPFQAISASSVSKASPTRGQLLDSAFNEQLELAHELIRAAVETTDEFEAVVGAFRERYGTPKDVAEEVLLLLEEILYSLRVDAVRERRDRAVSRNSVWVQMKRLQQSLGYAR